MGVRKPIFFDAKHEKARQKYREYMSNPVNHDRVRKREKERYWKDPEKSRLYRQEYYKKNPTRIQNATNEWRLVNAEKFNAGFAAQRNIPLKDACEVCGITKDKARLERHHADYSKPLDVITVCRKCHRAIHREWKKTGYSPPKDDWSTHHCGSCAKLWPSCGRSRSCKKGRQSCLLWERCKPENPSVSL